MKRAALGAAIVTTALVLVPRGSDAQTRQSADPPSADDGEPVSLAFAEGAAADCPSELDFKAEVTKLTSKARFTKQGGARRIRIELDSRGGSVFGRLVTGDGKNQSSREVQGQDCKEVASALAIAVALTIDPEALGAGAPSEPVTAPPPPEPPRPKPVPAPPPTAPSKLLLGLGAGLTLESAWGPHLRPGGHVFFVFGVGERFRMHLGGTRFPTREDDDVSFGAWVAQGGVSWNLAVLGAVRPFAGLEYEAGVVEASGGGLVTKVDAERPWQALSASLGLRFEMERFFLELGGSFLVPVSRQRYLISDRLGKLTTIYETPRFGLKQETSLGVFL